MSQFFDSIKVVKNNYSKYDTWEQSQADERAKKEYLAKILELPKDEVELTRKKAETVIRATEIMDRYSEDNCEDMEQATGIAAAVPITILGLAYNPLISAVMNNATNKINTKIQNLRNLQAIGDAKTKPEDIAKQIEILQKKLSNVRGKYPLYGAGIYAAASLGLAASLILWGNSEQKEASRIGRFQARQKDLKDIRNFVIYTPEQLKQAEEAAKKLPDEKEKNGLLKMISNLRDISRDKKAYKEWFDSKDPEAIEKLKKLTYTPEQLKAAKSDQELIVETVKEINIKAEEYSENLENTFDTFETLSWLAAIPVGWVLNSGMKLFKVPGKIRALVSLGVPGMTSLGISIYGTFAQKEAARVGRYIARKDLSSNPARLMAYSDEDMKKAENIRAPKQKKSVKEKISNSFSFLTQYLKDKKEYDKYKKTAHQQQEKMHKAFADIKITDAQKKEAENLQKKVFLAFDEIDEMSQRYSEDVEAGTEIAKNAFSQFWSLAWAGTIAAGSIALFKGKFPISKIVNSIVNIGFKKESSLRAAVNEFYGVLKQDKNLMHKFQRSIVEGNFKTFMQLEKAKPLLPAYQKLMLELVSIFKNVNPSNTKTFNGVLDNHLKQGAFAKWVRNLTLQSAELYLRKKTNMPAGELSNYKTLIGTGAVAGIPVLGMIFAVPYTLNAWLTDIQKKAGKIGIMKAMEKIDDPKVFADKDSQPSAA